MVINTLRMTSHYVTPSTTILHRRFAQIVFEVKVEPSSYTIQSSTLSGSHHWQRRLRVDPRFETHRDLEWKIEHSSKVS